MIKLNKKGDVVMLFPGDRYDKVLEVYPLISDLIYSDGNLLRFIRQSKGLTQPQFAQLLGVSHAYISYLETGSKPMTANIRNKVRGLVGDEYIERCRQFIGSISR
jgi:putative transcriptional regulator